MADRDDLKLTTSTTDLTSLLMVEEDPAELDRIMRLFNVQLQKQDMVRKLKLSDAQDKVVDQMHARLNKRADEFSNRDLLDYYKTIQDGIYRESEVPQIQINQINNNVSAEEFNRESREKILAAVATIMSEVQESDDDFEVIDIPESEVEEVE